MGQLGKLAEQLVFEACCLRCLQLFFLLAQLPHFFLQGFNCPGGLSWLAEQLPDFLQVGKLVVEPLLGGICGHCLNAADTSSNGSFRDNPEQADLARGSNMRATAELYGKSGIKSDNAHELAIFFTKQHHGTRLPGLVNGHAAALIECYVFPDFAIDDLLNPRELFFGDFLEM